MISITVTWLSTLNQLILALCYVLILLWSGDSKAQLRFDPAMISGDKNAVADLSQFDNIGRQLPGTYDVDIYLNGTKLTNKNINFVATKGMKVKPSGIKDNTGLMACLNKKDLANFGVNVNISKELKKLNDHTCLSPGNYFNSAYTKFNFQKMRLDINIPQAYLQQLRNNSISDTDWDNGINGALLSWQYSGNKNGGKYGRSLNQYLNLTTGLNFGAWRFRDNSIWTSFNSAYNHQQSWQHLDTYLMRPLVSWRSNLTIGNSQSNGIIFDPISFNGIQLATDLNMYPEAMQGFAPVIRGVAAGNADVYVYQNGNLIYRTAVPAGAFVINDLSSISNSGDLKVTVKEANGSESHFTVPYSTVPVLQRKGRIVYSVAAGRIRDSNNIYQPLPFIHGTFRWGLTDNTTIYGGTQLADRYKAEAIGAGINVGDLGAISIDATHADSVLSDSTKHQGVSWRLLYSRSMLSTGTSLQILANRFSTRGYYSLSEAALNNMHGWINGIDSSSQNDNQQDTDWSNYYNLYQPKKNLFQINLSQNLNSFGSLYIMASRQTYWDNVPPTTSLQAGFNSIIGNVNYQVSLGYSKYSDQAGADKNIFLSFSVPLSGFSSSDQENDFLHNTMLTYSLNGTNKNALNLIQLSGTALKSDNLSWGISQGSDLRSEYSEDTSLDYQGTYGGLSLGYGQSNDQSQLRFGTSGGAILSAYGLTVGQQLGSTNILVAAPGASDIPVENNPGVSTDWRGYAIQNYASNYMENRIALDIDALNSSTDITNPVKYVVPTEGAIALARFDVDRGQQALMTLLHNGKKLPFGTIVTSSGSSLTGIVDEYGEVYLSGLKEKGILNAVWGDKRYQHCKTYYDFSRKKSSGSIMLLQSKCE